MLFFISSVILFLLSFNPLFAGGGPENVLLVVNSNSEASRKIANEYIQLRKIPTINVLYLSGIKNVNTMKIDDFRSIILEPILKTIKERKLEKQIDYIVYSADFPWKIDCRNDLKGKKMPRILSPFGSITGLTYLYRAVMAKQPLGYISLNSNFYVRPPIYKPIRDTLWTKEDLYLQRKAYELLKELKERNNQTKNSKNKKNKKKSIIRNEKNFETIRRLIDIFKKLKKRHPCNPSVLYNLACMFAKNNENERAMKYLEEAFKAGWWNEPHTRQDNDLKTLRGRKDFRELLEKMKNVKFQVPPAIGFKSYLGWLPNGKIVLGKNGRHYLLAMVLGITTGRGNTVDEIISYLKRSVSADNTFPKGTVYIMKNKNIRSTTREWAFKRTVEMLQELGVNAEILQGILPKKKNDVIGAVIGAATFDWKKCGSIILPGAICEHLTSAGGIMFSKAHQTPLSEFLRYGAAGASGTVVEPYALQEKFPMPLIHVFYAEGCSLAEAFYQSVAGPYQLLIVGDPLCQPWAKKFEIVLSGIKNNMKLKKAITIKPSTKEKNVKIAYFDIFIDGLFIYRLKPGRTFNLDPGKVKPGEHELRVVGVMASPVQTQSRIILKFIIK